MNAKDVLDLVNAYTLMKDAGRFDEAIAIRNEMMRQLNAAKDAERLSAEQPESVCRLFMSEAIGQVPIIGTTEQDIETAAGLARTVEQKWKAKYEAAERKIARLEAENKGWREVCETATEECHRLTLRAGEAEANETYAKEAANLTLAIANKQAEQIDKVRAAVTVLNAALATDPRDNGHRL